MLISGIKLQSGTMKKLNNLLSDNSKKIYGVFYTNDFFSERYLARAHALVDKIDVEEEHIRFLVSTRVESAGMTEIDETFHMLNEYEAGDIPKYKSPRLVEEDDAEYPYIPEVVGAVTYVYTIDILLNMKKPTITYQEFSLAGGKFTLVNLTERLEDEFEQTVSLLFGETDKLYLFSHLLNKELTARDAKIIFDLIIDENITGKAIRSVKLVSYSGSGAGVLPHKGMISSYLSTSNEYIIGDGSGYIRIPKDSLKDYKMALHTEGSTGSFRLDLMGKRDTIMIYFE